MTQAQVVEGKYKFENTELEVIAVLSYAEALRVHTEQVQLPLLAKAVAAYPEASKGLWVLYNIPMKDTKVLPIDLFLDFATKVTPLEELDLSVKAYTVLMRSGVQSVEHLKALRLPEDLMRMRNMGRMSFNEIVTKIGREDLAF